MGQKLAKRDGNQDIVWTLCFIYHFNCFPIYLITFAVDLARWNIEQQVLGQLAFIVVLLRSTKKGLWVEGAKKSDIVRKRTSVSLRSSHAFFWTPQGQPPPCPHQQEAALVCVALPAGQLRPEGMRPARIALEEVLAIHQGCLPFPSGLGESVEGNRSVSVGFSNF